jgi:flavin-dependent dehydrogenase
MTEWALELKVSKQMWKNFESPERAEVMAHDVQIVRPEAETIMLEQARKLPNVTVYDTGRVRDVAFNEGGGEFHKVSWQDMKSQATHEVYAKWVIDCTGRARLLAKRLGHAAEAREFDDGFKTTAVWAQFKGISPEMFEDWKFRFSSGDVMDRHKSTLHLWGKGYWIWVIPLSKGRISVGATFDQRLNPPGTPKEQLWHFINRYPVLKRVLTEENMLEFRMFKNPQILTDTFVHPTRYGMVGDAGAVIDAYYSQGMSLAFVTSWHMANIVEKDVKAKKLDKEYIDRVNRNMFQDWHILRNMVRYKYTDAIADPRFFILSHVLDQVIFTGLLQHRHWLGRWLFETDGDTSRETEEHKEFRESLSKGLFYSRGGILGKLLSPESVRHLQGYLQKTLAERALWRLENGVHLPRTRALVRFPSSPVPLERLKEAFSKKFLDLSPERIPAKQVDRIKYRGTEKNVLLTRITPILILSKFLGAYAYDAMETAALKKKMKTSGARKADDAPVGSEPKAAAQAA